MIAKTWGITILAIAFMIAVSAAPDDNQTEYARCANTSAFEAGSPARPAPMQLHGCRSSFPMIARLAEIARHARRS